MHLVTGAYGYTGKYISARLLEAGCKVRTLTNSIHRENPFSNQIEAIPYHFDHPELLVEAMRGVSVLYNTYWIRFNYTYFNHAEALVNSLRLLEAAAKAGVQRVVHVSITNPSEDSPLEYFRGKARLERTLRESGMSYAILRPAVFFGKEDILINNIAWVLRHFPVFGVFGTGNYRLQPIYIEDFADLAVQQGFSMQNTIVNAIGPETFTYKELVKKVGQIIGKQRPIIYTPPGIGYSTGWIIGKLMGDVMITQDEIEGLMQDLLYTASPPVGATRLTEWARAHADTLGKRYANELARRKNRERAYENL